MRRAACLVMLVCLGMMAARPASAHTGPPYPLIVDEVIGEYLVSVWADPDIGVGTFYLVAEAVEGRAPADPTRVGFHVEPVSGRLAEVSYEATPEESRVGAQFVARVPFDRGEFWHVRITVEGPGGSGEMRADVEATPDGSIGPIGLVVYAIPFVLVAVLWIRVTIARRRAAEEP